jgi:hypothetical protein
MAIKIRLILNKNQPLGLIDVFPKAETVFLNGEYPGYKKAAGIKKA